MKAKELLSALVSAVVILTDGRNLTINTDRTGRFGVWRIRKDLDKDRVIIFRKNLQSGKNEVFIGDFLRLAPSDIEGLEERFFVLFKDIEQIGETDKNWQDFIEAGKGAANPIKCL